MCEKKISVVIITYNQERFLARAIESVIRQNVEFDYEVLIGDDCSTDNTADIVRKYAELYPDKIVPVIRDKNLGMTGNEEDLVKRTKGEYVAFLEGDDYWLSDDKLQKQVDFLDSHRDYVAVFSKCIFVDGEDNIIPDMEKWSVYTQKTGEYTIKDFQEYLLPGQTGTSVYRRKALESLQDIYREANIDIKDRVDIFQVLCILSLGKMYIINDKLSAYRYMTCEGSNSWSSQNDVYSFKTLKNFIDGLKKLERTACMLGFQLDYDERRVYELRKLYSDNSLLHEEVKKMNSLIKAGFNSKIKYWYAFCKLKIKR